MGRAGGTGTEKWRKLYLNNSKYIYIILQSQERAIFITGLHVALILSTNLS